MNQRLESIQAQIAAAAAQVDRSAEEITLVAVSKTRPVSDIETAIALGLTHFGENYLQDAKPKIEKIGTRACWHFIGAIQSNKTKEIAALFDWADTVDREKVIRRLAAERAELMECSDLSPLNICVQVNISEEESKSGCQPEQAGALCDLVESQPSLRLRGLMGMAGLNHDPAPEFRALKRLYDQLSSGRQHFDTLSIGMSGDFEQAITCGSTMVRVGTALFGERLPR